MPEPDAGPTRVRVLLVAAQSVGGIGRHVRALSAGLPRRGVAVSLCAPPQTIEAIGVDPAAVAVSAAPLGSRSPSALIRSRKALRQAATDVDIVHAHGLRAGALCAAFLPGRMLVVTWHNAAQGGRLRRFEHGVLTRYVARSATLTLAASDDLAATATAAGAGDVRSVFVSTDPPPVRRRSAEEIRSDLDIGSRPLVIAVGRLARQKRLDVLVAAASAWADEENSPIVVIAGDGPARRELEAQIAASRAPVRLLGHRDDVADLLGAADVMTLPSEWEARALVAQEALRAGVALVTTAVGGLPGLVGEAAVFVPVGDPEALRSALDGLLADRPRRDRLVALGLARAAQWPDQDQSIDELAATYLDLKHRMRPGRD